MFLLGEIFEGIKLKMNKSFKLALLTALSLNLGFSGCQNQSLTAPISTRIEPQQKSLKHNQVLIPNGLTLYSKDPNIILASSMPELLKKI